MSMDVQARLTPTQEDLKLEILCPLREWQP